MEKTNKKSIFTWIKDYPTKAVIALLLIVLPIFLITIFTVNFVKNNKKFYFDKENETPIYLHQSDVASEKTMKKYFESFTVELKDNKIDLDDNDQFVRQTYKFLIDYEATKSYSGSNVKMTFKWVLATDWINYQTTPATLSISSTGNTIVFDKELPKTKYLFFTAKRPHLYIQITITKNFSDTGGVTPEPEVSTLYYKHKLA